MKKNNNKNFLLIILLLVSLYSYSVFAQIDDYDYCTPRGGICGYCPDSNKITGQDNNALNYCQNYYEGGAGYACCCPNGYQPTPGGGYCEISPETSAGTAVIPAGTPVRVAIQQAVSIPAGTSTYYKYDAMGNLIQIKDALAMQGKTDRIVENRYNSLGQLIFTSHPDTGVVLFDYDNNGNMIIRNMNGVITRYVYDELNRLVTTDYPTSTDMGNFYDGDDSGFECLNNNLYAKGKLCAVKDASGTMWFGYDSWGRMTIERKRIENRLVDPAKEYQIEAVYDYAGNAKSISLNGEVIARYGYNHLNQLVKVTDKNGREIRYEYNPESTLKAIDFNSGKIRTAYTYTERDWLKTLSTNPLAGSWDLKRSYEYDPVGNIIGLFKSDAAVPSPQDKLAAFIYDPLDRLKTVAGQTSTGFYYGQEPITYTYDLVGNRLTENGISYKYADLSGQHGSQRNNRMIQAGSVNFAYDANGNMVSEDNANYLYDDENRPIRAVTLNSTNEYIYDANGLRAVKNDSQGTTIYIYDFAGNNIYEENI